MIMRSPSLRDLNVACNPLNVDGGFKVLEGNFKWYKCMLKIFSQRCSRYFFADKSVFDRCQSVQQDPQIGCKTHWMWQRS